MITLSETRIEFTIGEMNKLCALMIECRHSKTPGPRKKPGRFCILQTGFLHADLTETISLRALVRRGTREASCLALVRSCAACSIDSGLALG